jgi:murein tripeptide amidase MpaA
MNSQQMSARLDTAANTYPNACARVSWLPGHNGASAGYVKIGATVPASPANRNAVLISGGVHARELVPPDAIISFVEKLLAAYKATSDVVYPSWTSPVDGTVYDSFIIAWPHIKPVVERLDLYVAPCVNADGRDWVVQKLPAGTDKATQDLHKLWRKNRRPAPAGSTSDWCVGVDINRNFDILWDYKTHFDLTVTDSHGVSDLGLDTSDDPCNQETYAGPSAESEPETQNLASLMRTKNISYFLDVHSIGREILYSWGLDTNQSGDASQSFTNPAKDHIRDGVHHTAYSEYIPTATAAAVAAMAQRMADFILKKAGGSNATAQARSVYQPKQSADLYITSGAADDYCFSRWFTAAQAGTPISPVMAFTIEVGSDKDDGSAEAEGGFNSDYVKYFPKIEREVHAALWGFLTAVAATNFQAASAPDPPAPPPTTSKSDCFVAGAAYRDPAHPAVVFLRDVRDSQLRATRPTDRFATALAAAYSRLSPPLARRLRHRPLAALARVLVLVPLVAALRLVSARTRRWPRLRSALLALTLALAALAPLAAAVALLYAGWRAR